MPQIWGNVSPQFGCRHKRYARAGPLRFALASPKVYFLLMAVSLKSLGIDRLGVEDRLALVEELWDSIAADSVAIPLTPVQREVLEHRLSDHQTHPEDAVSWEEVKASLDDRLKG